MIIYARSASWVDNGLLNTHVLLVTTEYRVQVILNLSTNDNIELRGF